MDFLYLIPSLKKPIFPWFDLTVPRENMRFCQMRERWQELSLLKKLDIPVLYAVANIQRDDSIAPFSIYSSKEKTMKTLRNRKIVQRSAANTFLAEFLEELGADLLVSAKEERHIMQWVDLVKYDYVKRTISRLKLDDIMTEDGLFKNSVLDAYSINNNVFIKTESKNISEVINLSKPSMSSGYFSLMDLDRKTSLIVSQPLNLTPAKEFAQLHPVEEYRCWIVDHSVSSISRYLDYDKHSIPASISSFAEEFVDAHRSIMPKLYVVDIGVDENLGPVVIECNPLSGSGRYIQNDFGKFIKQIMPEIEYGKIREAQYTINIEGERLLKQHTEYIASLKPKKFNFNFRNL